MIQDVNEIFVVSIARIILRSTGEMIDVTNSITGIAVKNDYLVNKMPLFTISMKVTEEVRDIIRDNDINLFIQCNICDNKGESNELDNTTIYEKGILFSETIRIYDKPLEFVNRVKDYDNDDPNTIANSVNTIDVTVSGTLDNTLQFNQNTFNELYYNTTCISALCNLLTRAGIKNINIDSGYKTDIHKNILIPPIPPLRCAEYLQNYYNIFQNRAKLYMDINNSCFIFDPCHISSYSNIVQLNVTSENTSNLNSTVRPQENTENNYLYITSLQDPNFVTGGKITKHTLGSKTIFVSYDDAYNIISREYSDDEAFDKTTYFWNPDNSLSSELSYYNDTERDSGFAYVLTNINPYRITPRTLFRVITESELINGDYSITAMSYTLQTYESQQSRYMNCMVHLTLNKIKETVT